MDNVIRTTIDGERISITDALIEKYDAALPRYTSYPPAPLWTEKVDAARFASALKSFDANSMSLYLHLPFCRSRCTFCACHAIATTRSDIIDIYIESVVKEMDVVLELLGKKVIRLDSIHWGGGTPTYLSEAQMRTLMSETKKRFYIEEGTEAGIEADPRQTTPEKVAVARKLGFTRISFGVQDTQPEVQKACGRTQDIAHVRSLFDAARKEGFSSINADICYGLPHQTPQGFDRTLSDIIDLAPDRIALFNFAYVPWMQPHQRKIDPKSVPDARTKVAMFVHAVERFSAASYSFIGLDHFAKEDDELSLAKDRNVLKRTFQGYTSKPSRHLLGIGVTSISEWDDLYFQNERRLSRYLEAVETGRLATCRGFEMSKDDLIRRHIMQRIFCEQRIDKARFHTVSGADFDDYFKKMRFDELVNDGLIVEGPSELKVTPLGRVFIRNIAAAFDDRLETSQKRYSRSV